MGQELGQGFSEAILVHSYPIKHRKAAERRCSPVTGDETLCKLGRTGLTADLHSFLDAHTQKSC